MVAAARYSPLLHTLAERGPHHRAVAVGLCGLVEEEHLREHGCSCPGERHPDAVLARGATRNRPWLAYPNPCRTRWTFCGTFVRSASYIVALRRGRGCSRKSALARKVS